MALEDARVRDGWSIQAGPNLCETLLLWHEEGLSKRCLTKVRCGQGDSSASCGTHRTTCPLGTEGCGWRMAPELGHPFGFRERSKKGISDLISRVPSCKAGEC